MPVLSSFHNAHVNLGFDRIVRRVQTWLESRVRGEGGYPAHDVSNRLAQRIVELCLFPYSRESLRRFERNEAPIDLGPSFIELGGLSVNLTTGEVRPGLLLLLKSIAAFALHWLHVLGSLLAGFWPTGHVERRPATLVLGVGTESLFVDGSDARFVDFCRRGPIAPLATAHRLVVHTTSGHQSSAPELVEYSRFPLLSLARKTRMPLSDRITCLLGQFAAVGNYLCAIWHLPAMAILGRDFAYTPLLKLLNGLGAIDAMVISNSVYGRQPLWMRGLPGRRFGVHIVWYSQNTYPFVYARDQLVSDVPSYRHLCVDVSWVWTPGYASYLERLGIKADIRVVGPILWYLPKDFDSVAGRRDITIAVFDVTPVKPDFARHLGLIYNYYSGATLAQFFDDIAHAARHIEKVTGRKTRMTLKQKRKVNLDLQIPIHELPAENDLSIAFELLSPNASMFEMLAGSDVAIVLPYSSPAYVAAHMDIPAIYHDPTQNLHPSHEKHPGIRFTSGRDQLVRALEQTVAEGRL